MYGGTLFGKRKGIAPSFHSIHVHLHVYAVVSSRDVSPGVERNGGTCDGHEPSRRRAVDIHEEGCLALRGAIREQKQVIRFGKVSDIAFAHDGWEESVRGYENPGIYRDRRRRVQTGVVWNFNKVVRAVKRERVAHLARVTGRGPIFEYAVVSPDHVLGVRVRRPAQRKHRRCASRGRRESAMASCQRSEGRRSHWSDDRCYSEDDHSVFPRRPTFSIHAWEGHHYPKGNRDYCLHDLQIVARAQRLVCPEPGPQTSPDR